MNRFWFAMLLLAITAGYSRSLHGTELPVQPQSQNHTEWVTEALLREFEGWAIAVEYPRAGSVSELRPLGDQRDARPAVFAGRSELTLPAVQTPLLRRT